MSNKTVAAKTASKTSQQSDTPTTGNSKKAPSVWDVFTNMGALPARVRHDNYKAEHPSDLACHTTLIPTAANVLSHLNPDHGIGTFRIKLRVSETKTSPLWQGLADAGVTIVECWCPHCRQDVPISAKRLVAHIGPHPGANRLNLDPMVLCFTLALPGDASREFIDEDDNY